MEPEAVINPQILERSTEMVKGWEGCLSIPGIRGEVPRHRRIRVRYQTVAGQQIEREFTDFVARIFQHEDDHLRGMRTPRPAREHARHHHRAGIPEVAQVMNTR